MNNNKHINETDEFDLDMALERVRRMVEDKEKWGLSNNDKKAIKMVLESREKLVNEIIKNAARWPIPKG